MNLLSELVEYLSSKTTLVPGDDLFYNTMYDTPDNAVCLQLSPLSYSTPSPINGEVTIVDVTVRNESNDAAYNIGKEIYRWLYTDKEDVEDADGLIKVSNALTIATSMYGPPVWSRTDDKDRKYFTFKVKIFSRRII